jgi:hypothetical protein
MYVALAHKATLLNLEDNANAAARPAPQKINCST